MNEESLEKALRESLRREPAPPDFAARVMKAAQAHPAQTYKSPRRSFTLALAAAIAAAAIVPAVIIDRQHRAAEKRTRARQDLLTALAITRTQIELARQKVEFATRNIQ
jgi:hypothetical protein